MPTTVLAFTGGLSSTTLLWKLRRERHRVRCLHLDYGQPGAARELAAAERIISLANVDRREGQEIDLKAATLEGFHLPDLPSHGPLRSLEFSSAGGLIVMACVAHASTIGADRVACAVTAERTVEDLEPHLAVVASLVTADRVAMDMPYKERYQGEVLALGRAIGAPLDRTRSCLLSRIWHCGSCRGCRDRRRAFVAAGLPDLTKYTGDGDDAPPPLPQEARASAA
jgi:7-cyano-7-deazaguanine synthase